VFTVLDHYNNSLCRFLVVGCLSPATICGGILSKQLFESMLSLLLLK